MAASPPCIILVSAPTPGEARAIARALVEERLAACCSIVPGVTSVYRWEQRIEETPECLLICKGLTGRFEELEARIRELHSYVVPEIVMLPIAAGSAPYLEWLVEAATPEAAPREA
jgi:periplasmic divalent cation tolerance protein